MGLNPDLAARKIIVAAYCYYVLDDGPMTDHEYDAMSKYVAEHWDQLSPERQWQLGDPVATAAGGSHFKFTVLAVDASRTLFRERNKRLPDYPYPHKWKTDRKMKLRYVTAVAA
jgi:hypothetical protein